MPKTGKSIKNIKRRLRYRSVEFDMKPYEKWINDINAINLKDHTDQQLREMSLELMRKARSGVSLNKLLVPAYALVKEVSGRVLKLFPYDVQLIAAIAMHDCGVVEMQTGEGKTLSAVFPAYLNALPGRGVHVLTFNDYLARRDAQWMGRLYGFLGMEVRYVNEGMSLEERRKAYSADITYLTAKEAGFDYLKSFLCYEQHEIVQRPFNFAIVDEADSILVDEARIPLVIAGRTDDDHIDISIITTIIKSFEPHTDYETDEYERNVYLTDKGLDKVEGMLNCGNLYNGSNTRLLADINNALHAELLLKRDVDYIVRNGKVEIVDEFTGRVAENRHWPHGLQEAVEAKEGITSQHKGKILASITLQNFIGMYPKVCGMTGTAVTSADEIARFYGMKVFVVPTNRPCIRKDHSDAIFTHKEAKYNAVIKEIKRVHQTGRPILVGTCNVEESETIAGRLQKEGVHCGILNAKNDELEAGIIAKAGEHYAVTVSTNMAGRGTDIKLGGENEENREAVADLGGLYVIGTSKHESRRIDDQLRGRAGRQGDPGESRFFLSLEDDLLKRYRIKELIPEAVFSKKQDDPVENLIIKREVARAQRIIEGQNFEIRRTLTKYSIVMEKQRNFIFNWRNEILTGRSLPGIMPQKLPQRYSELLPLVGREALAKAEKQLALYHINRCWADYIDYMSYMKENIYLVNMASKVPVDEYNRAAVASFDKLVNEITDEITNTLATAEITGDGIEMGKAGIKAPSSTWTYLINDSAEQMGINPINFSPVASMFIWPLMLAGALYYRFFVKKRHLK